MEMKIKMKYFFPSATILGIALLYWMSTISQPIAIEINDVEKYEGRDVVVEGIAIDKISMEYGEIIKIEENGSQLSIFIQNPTPVDYGDRIRARGEVRKYRNEWEIAADKIEVIGHWESNSFPLWQLAQNRSQYEGTNVNVTGYIKNLHPSYFYLTDEEYSIKVLYGENATIDEIKKYDHVCVKAMFIFDNKKFDFYLEAKRAEHAIIKIE